MSSLSKLHQQLEDLRDQMVRLIEAEIPASIGTPDFDHLVALRKSSQAIDHPIWRRTWEERRAASGLFVPETKKSRRKKAGSSRR